MHFRQHFEIQDGHLYLFLAVSGSAVKARQIQAINLMVALVRDTKG